jgi:acyl dehydratase
MAGMYFEDFEVGAILKHGAARTVTETDNVLITALTMNPQPLHLDREFAAQTMYGQPLVNSIFTLALVVGLTVADTTLGTTLGNLGFEEVKFPRPVFCGDTIHVETEILSKRVSNSRPEAGIVFFRHRGFNHRDELVCDCRRAGMMRRREEAGG